MSADRLPVRSPVICLARRRCGARPQQCAAWPPGTDDDRLSWRHPTLQLCRRPAIKLISVAVVVAQLSDERCHIIAVYRLIVERRCDAADMAYKLMINMSSTETVTHGVNRAVTVT